MARRKTSKDYRAEYDDLLLKQKALVARIKNRAQQLCKQHPDVPIGYGATGKEIEKIPIHNNVQFYLDVIKHIEEHNARQANIQQGKLKF